MKIVGEAKCLEAEESVQRSDEEGCRRDLTLLSVAQNDRDSRQRYGSQCVILRERSD